MGLINRFRQSDIVQEMTLPMLAVSAYASVGGLCYGIDYNYWSGLLGEKIFQEHFGVWDAAAKKYYFPSSWQSSGSALPVAGLSFGAIMAGFVGNALGRVRTFQIASLISFVGIIIQASAITSFWQIVVGRVVNSLALGVLSNAVPAYQAECAPSKIRGTLINFYQFSLGLGAVFVATANWGLNTRPDQWAYRVVILLQLLGPVVLLAGSFWIPESARWLAGKGREAEALAVLKIMRRNQPDHILEQETRLLIEAEEQNKSSFSTSWVECFKGTNLRRTLIATGVQSLQQAQGTSFMSNYAVVFLQMIGIQDTFKIQVLLVFTMAMSSVFAFYLPDRIGRRWIMIVSSLAMGISLFTVGGVAASGLVPDSPSMKAAMAFLFIWWFAVAIGWSSCVWIVTAEVPTLQLREKTIMIAYFVGHGIVSIIVTFVSPFLQNPGYGNLGSKIGFVYGGFSVAAALWCLFFLPETAFRTLEELDELFAKGVSVWKFRSYKTSGFGAQIAEVENHVTEGVHPKLEDDMEAEQEHRTVVTKV